MTEAVCFVKSQGLRDMLSKFSPIRMAATPQEVFSLLSLSGLLLVEECACPKSIDHFLEESKAINPQCQVVILTEDTDVNRLLPYIWQHRVSGFCFYPIQTSPDTSHDDSAEMMRDILSMEYVHDLIYGHIGRLDEVKSLFSSAGIDIQPQIVMTIIVDDFWSICEHLHNRERYNIKRRLLNSTRDALKLHNVDGVATTLIGTDKVVVVVHCGEYTGEQAEVFAVDCAERIKSTVAKQCCLSISIGVSRFCEQKSFLWRAYEQSFRALQGAFHQGKNRVLFYQQPSSTQAEWPEREFAKHQLILGISTNDTAHCENAINELLSMLVIQNRDEVEIKSMVVVLLSELSQYAVQIGLDSTTISSDIIRLVGTTFKSTSVADIQSAVLQHLYQLVRQVHGVYSTDNLMRIARAYLNQYYMNDITLQDIATLCGYSTSHFSRSFKEYYKQNFVQYLMQVRIEKAKEFLRSTDLTVSQIADRAGFKSMSYFSTVFKKEVGVSPAQFRSQHSYVGLGNELN